MTKKRIFVWMQAAILCCGLGMTSCVDEQMDNPSAEPEQGQAVSDGRWWLDESYMDKSVKPGDDFFMYCIGTWWKNTALREPGDIITRFDINGQSNFSDRVWNLTDANYDRFQSHMKWAEAGSDAAKAGQKAYDAVLEQSGMNEAKTNEEILKAFGKMGALGAATSVWLEPFSLHGKVCLYVSFTEREVNMEYVTRSDEADDNGLKTSGRTSLQSMIKKNPEIMAHLVPLDGKGGTRAIADKYSALRYILEGMGINTDDTYIVDDYVKFTDTSTDPNLQAEMQIFQTYFSALETKMKSDTPEVLKQELLKYYRDDYGFISKETMAEYNKEKMEETKAAKLLTRAAADDEVASDLLSLDTLQTTLDDRYLPYLRSKLVADQMVPKGLKEEYLKHCYEMKDVFAQRIKDNAWLSEGSKQNALEKLDAMTFNVCYPEKWYAEGLPDFSKNTSLVEDIYTFRKARLNLLKAIVGKTAAENDISFTIIMMNKESHLGIENAYYDFSANSMNILPFYTLPPFYDATQSIAINYQCFDTLCHEMTHGFDTTGSKFDKLGDFKEGGIWASAADKAEFDRRADLLVKWYESLDVLPDELPGVKAVGKGTVGENIADLGGTEIAWQAYLNRLKADGYTGDQLKLMKQRFFLSYTEEYRAKYDGKYVNMVAFGIGDSEGADIHSMNRERVNGVVANMDGWYEAFDIKDGTLYRAPADRIKIW